jgi:probable F420-dependent oxidoreductase
MELAVQYPADVLGSDPAVLRGFVQAAEAAGYARFVLPEHVLGADPDRPGGWDGPYTYRHHWPEPFTTFGFLAAVTESIELMTGVLILPQRQTVLVAKQAAQVDVMSNGRIALGVGTGWNPVEYDGLGQDFATRGRRMEEQVGLMRRLWREPIVTFDGEFDHVDRAGINPLPTRGDIPIWMGGRGPRILDRIGRIGDGWFPLLLRPSETAEGMERIREAAAGAGRDPEAIGLMCMVTETGNLEKQVEMVGRYGEAGATHLVLSVQSDESLRTLEQHVDRFTRFAEAVRAAG